MERDDSRHCGACDGHGRDEPVPYDCDHLATIATLRAALDGLVAAAADFLADWDGFDDVRPSRTGDALRTALAAAREVTP